MLILVSNDDGVYSPGLRDLALALSSLGTVCVAAPSGERSAAGHALTMRLPIVVQEVKVEGASHAWSIDGTPADCVKLGLEVLLDGQYPDIVVSGINVGPNLGTDVLYSGTVSAAMEGTIEGIPSIAVSLASFANLDFSAACEFTVKLVKRRLASRGDVSDQTLLNVNVPAIPRTEMKGVKITRLGVRRYTNVFDRRVDPRGRTYFWMAGELQKGSGHSEDDTHDTWAVENGYISVTPIRLEYTAEGMIEHLERWGLEP